MSYIFSGSSCICGETWSWLEEAARILRYDCYKEAAESVKKEFPEKKIRLALAHHAEDNAETVLFQMVRGSGLDGLCGMSRRRMRGFTN